MKCKNFFLTALVFALCVCGVARAATTDNSCEISGNDYVAPELVLCSTHVYNIGGETNPGDAATRQLMQDVIALKTTVMTQQIKKQYDFLDATIKRLKTQLEKTILTAQFEAAGAASSNSKNGGYASENANVYIVGLNDCGTMFDMGQMIECLQYHYTQINNLSNYGRKPETEHRRQLAKDMDLACKQSKKTDGECVANGKCVNTSKGVTGTAKDFETCLTGFATVVRNLTNEYQKEQNKKK